MTRRAKIDANDPEQTSSASARSKRTAPLPFGFIDKRDSFEDGQPSPLEILLSGPRYVRVRIGNVSADLLVSRTSMVDVSATEEMFFILESMKSRRASTSRTSRRST